ncbi:MAG: M16 family metallopeptidase [Planctomycetota bacterium]|jgi:zinc protease
MLPDVHEVHLDNGFLALLVERHTLPLVAAMLWYGVGSRDEAAGETGLSHFLEHMMFKGTDKYKKGEIDLLTSRMGGSNNAFTDNDVTAFHFSLAADRWETALEIEASRMRGCLLDDEEFAAEKQVVLEELAMGEDDPWRSLYQATESLIFHVHPYHHPVIGWRGDLERVEVATMRDYYRRNYGPDRAFLVVLGDIDLARTESRIRELFGPIQPIGQPRRQVLAEPPVRGERRCVVRFPGQISRMALGFRTCPMGEDDDFVLDVLSTVLGSGKSSRLYKRLVLAEELVTDVWVMNETRLDPGVFWITAELRKNAEPARVEVALREELGKLIDKGVAAAELKRARTQLRSSFLFEEEAALDAAMKIGRFQALSAKGYRQLAGVLGAFDKITNAQLKAVAKRYLHADAWNLAWSLPRDSVDGKTTKRRRPEHKKKKAQKKKAQKKKVQKKKRQKKQTGRRR